MKINFACDAKHEQPNGWYVKLSVVTSEKISTGFLELTVLDGEEASGFAPGAFYTFDIAPKILETESTPKESTENQVAPPDVPSAAPEAQEAEAAPLAPAVPEAEATGETKNDPLDSQPSPEVAP